MVWFTASFRRVIKKIERNSRGRNTDKEQNNYWIIQLTMIAFVNLNAELKMMCGRVLQVTGKACKSGLEGFLIWQMFICLSPTMETHKKADMWWLLYNLYTAKMDSDDLWNWWVPFEGTDRDQYWRQQISTDWTERSEDSAYLIRKNEGMSSPSPSKTRPCLFPALPWLKLNC